MIRHSVFGILCLALILGFLPRAVQAEAGPYLRIEVSATEDEVFTFIPTEVNNKKDLTVTYLNYPDWLSVLDNSIFGIPREGVTKESFLAITKNEGISDTSYIVVTIEPVNDAPSLTCEEEDLATAGLPYTYIAKADDPDNEDLTYSFSNYPEWMTAGGQVISGTPPKGTEDATFTVAVSDGENTTNQTVYLEVQKGESAQDEFNRLITSQLGFVVYPSPLDMQEHIVFFGFTWKGKSIKYTLNLYDMEGNSIHKIEEDAWNDEKIVRTHTFDSEKYHLESGHYVAELRILDKENGTVLKSRKIVWLDGPGAVASKG